MNQDMYNNVQMNYERYKRLYEKGYVSKYELENMQLNGEKY